MASQKFAAATRWAIPSLSLLFQCRMERVCTTVSSQGVLTMIKSVMLRSVYKEFDTQSFTLPSFAFEITALESYYRLVPCITRGVGVCIVS